ncbi:MAG: hypothetical protein ABSF12_07290 [Bryobacteraceae bacterium]|jgi:hypothetical protein
MRPFGRALIASLSIQTAVLAGYLDYPFWAAILWMVAGVVILQSVRVAGGGARRRTMRRMRDALATLILLGGMLRVAILLLPFGGGDRYRPPDLKTASKGSAADGSSASVDNSGDHTGVILLPEHQQHTTLVPPLPSMPSDLFDAKHQNPLTIPFYGAYWFFKLPDTRPPRDSFVTHGTPAEMTFYAPDSRPLIMEAHQNLGKLIDLNCCREIRIEIRNADRYPGTVSMELVLVNTRQGQEGSVSLGSSPVTSAPGEPDAPMKETLTFPISAHSPIRKFDELMIRFPRMRTRINRSAKIAIDRFVLIPRG